MIKIQTYDEATGGLTPVDYYDVVEAAAALHVSVSTVRRRCREGRWPCIDLRRTFYMSARDIGVAHDLQRHEVDPRDPRPGEPEPPPRLGIPVPEVEQESIR